MSVCGAQEGLTPSIVAVLVFRHQLAPSSPTTTIIRFPIVLPILTALEELLESALLVLLDTLQVLLLLSATPLRLAGISIYLYS